MNNPLHRYESYSYHLSLRIAPEAIGKQANAGLPASLGIVIAETGKTASFYIDKLEVNTVAPQQTAAITSAITSFNMTIVEQNGFSFIEKYFKGIAQMGWLQPTEAVLYLDISFNGWAPSGAVNQQVQKSSYRVKVIDIQTELDYSKQIYTLNLMPMNTMAFDEEELKQNRQFRSEIKKLFTDTVAEFQKQFNESIKNFESAENAPQPPHDEYIFVVGPRLLELMPEPEMNTITQVDTQTFMKDPDGKLYYTYCGGDRLDTQLIKLASNIKNIQTVLMSNTKPDETTDSDAEPSLDLAKQFKVTATTSLGEHNPEQNNYQRIFTYTIDLAVRPDIEDAPVNSVGSTSRVAAYAANGIPIKSYRYMFTGQNVDVLDVKFDLNLYYTFAANAYQKRFIESSPSVSNTGREFEDSKDKQYSKKMAKTFPSGLPNLLAPIAQFFNNGKLVENLSRRMGLSQMLNQRVRAKTSPEKSRQGVAVLEDPKTATQSRIVDDVLRRAIYCPMNNIVTIDLTIVGDPFWLDNVDLNSTAGQTDYSDKTALVRFDMLSGQPHQDQTGLTAEIGKVNFNGYYFITNVLSIFENGTFRQELKGIIDPTTLEAGSQIDPVSRQLIS